MNYQTHKTIRRWRYARFWKPAIVCIAALVVLAGSVHATSKYYTEEAAPVTSVVHSLAAETQLFYEWVHSGRTLFLMTAESGEIIFAGVQAIMRVPRTMKTGQLYSIPVYFTRFTPELCAASELQKVPTAINQGISWDQAHAISMQAKKLVPLDVFIGVGTGIHSSRSATQQKHYDVVIDIAMNAGKPWSYHIPLLITQTYAQDAHRQPAVCGLSQQVWSSAPPYRYLSDVPTDAWDGPYSITVKIEPLYAHPAEAEVVGTEQIFPPQPPATPDEQERTSHVSEYLSSTEQQIGPLPDLPLPYVLATEQSSTTHVSSSLKQASLRSVKSVDITMMDSKPFYQVEGVRSAKLLGIISVDIDVTLQIDIDTGAITTIHEPWWGFLVS